VAGAHGCRRRSGRRRARPVSWPDVAAGRRWLRRSAPWTTGACPWFVVVLAVPGARVSPCCSPSCRAAPQHECRPAASCEPSEAT
jgi:hypothetical protein